MKKEDATFYHCPYRFPSDWWRAEVIRVVDGDTAVLRIDRGFFDDSIIEIRFDSIDTWERFSRDPEERRKGKLAWEATKHLIEGDWCLLQTSMDPDKYGRIIGDIWFIPEGQADVVNLSDVLRELGHEKIKEIAE